MRVRRSDPLSTGREVDRLMAFSDGVVAVAITLMVLPLINIQGPAAGAPLYTVVTKNLGQLVIFLFTFYVVAVMWRLHSRIFSQIRGYDNPLFWLNITWLAAIVLLPWFSSLYGDTFAKSGSFTDFSTTAIVDIALFYWVLMASVSALGTLMGSHLSRNPHLLLPGSEAAILTGAARFRGWIIAGYFLFIGVISLFSPVIASYLPIGIFILSVFLKPKQTPVEVQSRAVTDSNGETT